ncbi:hypothetical protein HJG60_007983 [Phyllostomus discolor]|uniref:Uncharacterized protein n=1 Tax=Phyllostomus discolor TaxID=89673 RepID=A0A834BDH7_9CHIR|nr:hypothetical protein HJG60_007983 [Phyllostomus discolor]
MGPQREVQSAQFLPPPLQRKKAARLHHRDCIPWVPLSWVNSGVRRGPLAEQEGAPRGEDSVRQGTQDQWGQPISFCPHTFPNTPGEVTPKREGRLSLTSCVKYWTVPGTQWPPVKSYMAWVVGGGPGTAAGNNPPENKFVFVLFFSEVCA